MDIKPLDDVMNYFSFIFLTYISLFLVVIINFFKTIHITKKIISKDTKKIIFTDLIISVICGIAMYYGMLFMGVLADNDALNWSYWNKWLMFIGATSFVIFIINLIIVLRNKNKC